MQELLQHPLLAEEEEPPSPSPLMLKIPAAPTVSHTPIDKHAGPASPTHGHMGPGGGLHGMHRHGHGTANGGAPSFNAPSSLSASRR